MMKTVGAWKQFCTTIYNIPSKGRAQESCTSIKHVLAATTSQTAGTELLGISTLREATSVSQVRLAKLLLLHQQQIVGNGLEIIIWASFGLEDLV